MRMPRADGARPRRDPNCARRPVLVLVVGLGHSFDEGVHAMIVIGVDPGLTGAISFIDARAHLEGAQ